MDKYEHLFNLAKSVFQEELDRFYRIDGKASQYLTILTLLIGAGGYFGNWVIDNAFPPSSFIEWLLFLLACGIIASLVFAWYFNFRVLKSHALIKLPLDDETIEFYSNNELVDIHYAMTNGIKDALNKNKATTDKKSKFLFRGYKAILTTGTLLLIFIMVFLVRNGEEKPTNTKAMEVVQMSEETTDNGNNKPVEPPANVEKPPKATPDPKVKPPQFQVVTEGYDPSQAQRIVEEAKKSSATDSSDSKKKE